MATTQKTTKKRNATVVHMIVAMLVLFVPVVLVTRLFTVDPAEPPIRAIDWRPVAAQAAATASYDVLAPTNLPEGWISTRARFTESGRSLNGEPALGDTFQLGFLSPEQRYIALDQRDVAAGAFIAAVTRQGRPDGESAAGGRDWARYVSEDGRTHSLVEQQGDAASIVSGDLPYEALEAFASTLAPVS